MLCGHLQYKQVFLLWYHKVSLCEIKSKRNLFVFFFLNTYYVGIVVILRWPVSGISSELLLTIKTFEI
jgi:hypothetical protein